MTEEKRKYWEDVIARTGAHKEVILNTRIVPDYYRAFMEKVERKEVVVPVPAVEVPVTCYISFAKNRAENCPVHINAHGGGFVGPQNEDDDLYCARVADQIQGIVVDIDYALCPKYAFPVAFEQCYAVAKWVFSQCETWHADPEKVSMGGHSAGGNLTAAVSLKAGETGDFKFCLQVLDYPCMDLHTYPTEKPGGDVRAMPAEREVAFTNFYVDGEMELTKSPYVSPAFATDEMLVSQPKTVICSAGGCNFRFENEEYGRRLAAAGVEVIMKRFLNSRHGYSIRMVDEWDAAQQFIIQQIQNACR